MQGRCRCATATLGELGEWFVAAWSSISSTSMSRWTAGVRPNRRVMVGRRVSAPRSTRARTRRASRWRVAIPELSWSRARRSPKAAARRTAGALRRARHRCGQVAREHARTRTGLAAGLSPASLLVRADIPRARGKALRRNPIHVDDPGYNHSKFRPWRLIALAFKAIRAIRPDYPLWREFPYEYETTRLAIDLINGGPLLREWVEDPSASPADLDELARRDRNKWQSKE